MSQVRIFLTTTGAGTWTVPADWNNANNSIECIGGGIGGINYLTVNGGGGGAYSKKNNLVLTPGNSISYNIGSGGRGTDGGDTWFYSNTIVLAKGGTIPSGGQSSNGYGDIKYSGGNGGPGDSYFDFGGGGGGAAGPNGNGNNGGNYSSRVGGSGDAGYGGVGGSPTNPGGNGTEWDSTHGSGGGGGGSEKYSSGGGGGSYGAGGGGGNSENGSAGPGFQGLIVITYTPVVTSGFFKLLL